MRNDYTKATRKIARRDELTALIEQSRRELKGCTTDSQRLKSECDRLRNERDGLIGRLQPSDVHGFDQQISACQRELEAAETNMETLHERIRTAQEELSGIRFGSREAVLEHQAAEDAAAREVAKLETLLQEHQGRVDAASRFEDPLPALQERREDLLARIAAGEDKEGELATLEAEVATAASEVADRKSRDKATLERSQATLAGLARRLDAARAERDRLAAMTKAVLVGYLRTEMETEGKAYRKEAERIERSIDRLIGLGSLMESFDPSEAGRTGWKGGNTLRLPRLNLDAFADLKGDTGKLFLADLKNDGSHPNECREEQRQRLTEQGIRLS